MFELKPAIHVASKQPVKQSSLAHCTCSSAKLQLTNMQLDNNFRIVHTHTPTHTRWLPMQLQTSCTAFSSPQRTVNAPERLSQPDQDRLSGKLLRLPKPVIEIVDYIYAMTLVDLPHLFCRHLCDTNGHCMLLSLAIDGNRLTCFCLQTQTEPSNQYMFPYRLFKTTLAWLFSIPRLAEG